MMVIPPTIFFIRNQKKTQVK